MPKSQHPDLERIVPALAPETLHHLVQHRGLEASGELLISATPAQLTALADLDLWRHAQPGQDETFDVDRFGEWLEVLVNAGDATAARVVSTLDKHLVIAGLSRFIRVLDPGTFEPHESSDDEARDRHDLMNSETSRDVTECEVGGYLIRARRTDAWDAIVALLVTLDTAHHDDFHAVMEGCRRLSNSRPEIDGLDDLLMAPEQHLHDVTIEREQRRSRQGYATPADARAFLQMARESRHTPDSLGAGASTVASNPLVTAYFRAAEEGAHDPFLPDAGGHGARPAQPRALLTGAGADAGFARLPLLTTLMEFVLHHNEAAYFARYQELAFLVNTLRAGCSVQSRSLTPQEAADAAGAVCNLGLECWRGDASVLDDTFLSGHDLVTTFELGWSVLHRDVSLFVADRLIETLGHLHCVDPETRHDLHVFERVLVRQREAGTPWLARDAADGLAMLDMTAWISVRGLLDECPILPAALTAMLERRVTSVSPAAFEFISTRAQIGDIRVFMGMLPRVLSA